MRRIFGYTEIYGDRVMRIAVLVSGGVDSSVALALLRDAGHDVRAFYLKIWLEDELSYLGTCPWEEDLSYARGVCEKLGVPLEVLSFQQEYWDRVVIDMVADIKMGRTPNPDMLCNKRVKFGAFLDAIGATYDYVATGHYAQVVHHNGQVELHAAPDPIKDQSYFLAQLSREQLAKALFPIGHLMKSQVRELAQAYDLPTASRKDSQGICFLGKFSFADFVRHHCGISRGPLVEYETGKIMGEHDGFFYYTIGQRQGIGLAGGPWYVVAKDPARNTVCISKNYYAEDKLRDELMIESCHWFNEEPGSRSLEVKLRHGQARHAAQLTPLGDGAYSIKLATRDQGIAPGQFAVVYEGDRCLGSGVIAHSASLR